MTAKTLEEHRCASKCRSDNSLYGPVHYAVTVNGVSCYETACGQRIDDRWWIMDNNVSVTCKMCLNGGTIHDK